MDSRIKVNSNLFAELGEEFPESADQLGVLAEHFSVKQEKLAALVRYCAAHPELPMLRMYAEYSAAIDAVALETPREVEPELTEEALAKLDAHARAARTKRVRTHTRALTTASRMLLSTDQSLTLERVAEIAGIGVATLYAHFPYALTARSVCLRPFGWKQLKQPLHTPTRFTPPCAWLDMLRRQAGHFN